jgi:hypothetical protein
MAACDYCLSDCSDGGHSLSDEDCGLSRECFHVDIGGLDEGNHLGMPEDGDPPRPVPRVDILRELAMVLVPAGVRTHSSSKSARCRPGSTRKQDNLCSSGRTSGRSGQAERRPEKHVIWLRSSSTASLTTLGQGCPGFQWGRSEPGCSSNTTPSDVGTIYHRGAAYLGRAKESPGGCRGPTGRKLCLPKAGYPRSIAPRLPDSCGKPRSTPGARGTQRLQPRAASATSTTAATVEPTSMRRCAEATTPGVGDATTVGRIGVPRPNHPVCRLSVGPYDECGSRPGSEPRLPSPSTRGKQGRNCGSRTIDWPASWVERTMTTSSSATSPCSSPTPPEPGWSICLLRRSPTGTMIVA